MPRQAKAFKAKVYREFRADPRIYENNGHRWSLRRLARMYGIHETTASRWRKRAIAEAANDLL